ncbi:hypothetical protein QL285_075124 [Trifolium repens]|nr:hypothetical protein QL285_075124 [Trifolium repens]
MQLRKQEILNIKKRNYLGDNIGRRDGISLQVFNLTLVFLGDLQIRANFVLVVMQPIHLLPKASQGRTGPDESSNVVLDIQLKIPFPLHQWTKFLLQYFDTVLNGLFSRQVEVQ